MTDDPKRSCPRKGLVSVAFVLPLLVACASSSDEVEMDDPEHEEEPVAIAEALRSSVACVRGSHAAYSSGRRIGSVETMEIGGKRVSVTTGHAFLRLQEQASARGVTIWVNSGFRTMDEQQYFYDCYRTRRCNSGSLAARPGYSNHQSGRAVDIGASNRPKLDQLIRQLGLPWRRTVPSEPWHYEYLGTDPGGPCR